MRQAVMIAPGQIEIRDVPAPLCGPDEVLLRVRRIGICGSDIHVYHGKHPYTSYPVVQGHEFSGVIEAVGPRVHGFTVGQKATAMPQRTCGQCAPCRRGDYHICDRLAVMGFQAPGAAQDLFVVPADAVIPLPDALSFELGALVEPVSVAVHAVARAGDMRGRHATVLGAGPIGNLVAQVCRVAGASVLIRDLSPFRLEVARRSGLPLTSHAGHEPLLAGVGRAFAGRGFDVAFECVGSEQPMAEAIEGINKGGLIVVVGVFGQVPRVNLGLVQDRELTLRGTLMYRRDDYERAVALLNTGQIITASLEGPHFPLARYLEAYQHLDAAGAATMKVFIDL